MPHIQKMLIVFEMGRSMNFNYFLKACQLSRVHAHSCKTKNVPSMKMNISDVAKIKNCHKQNFKDKANNMGLDEENIQRSNLNSKCFSCIKISWFLYLLFLCSISLIIQYKAWLDIAVVSLTKCSKRFELVFYLLNLVTSEPFAKIGMAA